MACGFITRTVREAASEAAILVLHHARTGRLNIAQGVGFDAANFGGNAKTLFNASRCVMNLMPGSEDDHNRLVLSCCKASNCEPFQPPRLRFDPQGSSYSVDPDFDLGR